MSSLGSSRTHIVDSRAKRDCGASSRRRHLVGVRAVVEANPDGYTLLVSSSSALITTALLNKNDTST